MGKRKQRKSSFSGMVIKTIISIFILLFVYIAVSMVTVNIINGQVRDRIVLSSGYFASEVDRNLGNINDYLGNLVIGNSDVNTVRFSDDRMEFIRASQRVNDKLEFYRTNLDGGYRFFVYYTEQDYYNSSERGEMGIQEQKDLNRKMKDFISGDYEDKGERTRKKWRLQKVDGEWIAYNYFYYDGIYACSFIEAEQMTRFDDRMLPGEECFWVLQDRQGIPISGSKNNNKGGSMISDQPLEYAEFTIRMVAENNRSLIQAMALQYFIFFLLLSGILVTAVVLYRMKKKIIDPMRYFSFHLENLQQNPDNYYCEANEIVELEEANILFAKVLAQVKELKIKMYEQTVEKQQLQIEYLQLQIKPHFYINCLNIIYNMACIGDFEAIQKMSSFISDYFRYIFKPGAEYAPLEDELEHSRTYLNICTMRYQGRIEFEICKEHESLRVMIPLLVIKTFAENSVKYGMRQDRAVKIRISTKIIEKQKKYILIVIEDDGNGFPVKVLERLKKEEAAVTEKGEGTGIINCIRRLRAAYGTRAQLEFGNKDSGGARVSICIPAETEENGDEYITG